MATESPLRLIGGSGTANWPVSKDAAVFSASSNLAAGELGLLLEGQRYHGNRIVTGPNRSGSAPPSMEGSRAAFDLLKSQQFLKMDGSLETLVNVANNCKNEEQLRGHPAYLSYYCASVNLNPRLPPPLISRENRDLLNHISGLGDHLEMHSFDDNSKGPLFVSRAPLSTHKEEPEDDKSPRAHSIEDNKNANSQTRLNSMNSLQEDYPTSSLPVYNDYSRPSGHNEAEGAGSGTLDAFPNPEHDSSVDNNKADIRRFRTSTSGVRDCNSSTNAQAAGMKSGVDDASVSVPFSAFSDKIGGLQSGLNVEPNGMDLHNNNIHKSTRTSSDLNMEIEMKNLRLSNDGYRNQHERHLSHPVGINPWSSSSQAQIRQSHMFPQEVHHPQNSVEFFAHYQPKLSSANAPIQQSSTVTPFYAAATTCGTPYYSSLQPSNLFPPHFGIGGYAVNAPVMPPVMTGYPPHHSAIPVAIENPVNQSFAARSSGVSSAGSFIPGIDLQQFYKLYGQPGIPVLPSFSDQLYMPYFQHASVDINTTGAQYDFMVSRGNLVGNPSFSYDLQKGTTLSACLPDQRPPVPSLSSGRTLQSRKVNPASPNHHGSSPNLGVLVQNPDSPITSPLFQGSPALNPSFSGRRNDNMIYSPGSGRSAGSGWQGPRGREQVDIPKSNSFLEELKLNKARRYELSDIVGHIVEFSSDQHGSRFIQQKLECCNAEEKTSVFNEVLPHASALMTDVFGNYVIQKFFEHGSPEQRKELANKLVGNILPLSLQMYGCRVIQKALEVIELDQKTKLVQELDGHVMRCVRDQNGNHVIQKCIECVPAGKIGFIISSFRGQVAILSMHPYGCRVIQRVLEHCTDDSQSQCIVDEILQSACLLAQDQYGNYVTQHVLEKGKPNERSQIISKLAGRIVQMSQHKFASNVIERCLVYGDASEKEQLIDEIVDQTEGNDSLLMMMKDQFANYVVQKILETCSDKQREILLGRIKVHIHALKKYTYGKHIVTRVAQLCGEDDQSSES